MKIAQIKQVTKNGRTIYGTITEKIGDKFTISINHSSYYSQSQKFQFKKLANEIINSDFKHDAIVNLVDTGVTKQSELVVLLKKHTEILKKDFLDETKKYAVRIFDNHINLSKRTFKEWEQAFNVIEPAIKNYRSIEYKEYFKNREKMMNSRNFTIKLVKMGFEAFLDRELKSANNHYESSIFKLASRLKAKGVNPDTKLEITSAKVGVNFECYIKHDNKITKAWTIIAEGEIQKPHYRYLVK